jgi:REG-2-like HAD superfamily hydrolase
MAGRRAWRYVTLDATGTLLKPAEPTGETYLRFWEAASGESFSSAQRTAAAAALTTHFPAEFNLMSRRSPNFGSDGVSDSAFPWWRELVLNVMKRADVADCLRHNEEQGERFARELYAHFARPEAWTVFADVRPTLDALRRQEVPMGVISNFDERLHALLVGLELRDYFEVVTTSFGQSKMKPHASIFHSTFELLQREDGEVDASSFLHVGDHPSRDFKAAKGIGAQALLLWRSSSRSPPTDVEAADVIPTLEQIVPTMLEQCEQLR